ncbi:hypothetical protein D3C76_1265750 [compost metagenome]
MVRPYIYAGYETGPLAVQQGADQKNPEADRNALPGFFEYVVEGQDVGGHLVAQLLAKRNQDLVQRVEVTIEGAPRHLGLADHIVDHRGGAGRFGKYAHGRIEQSSAHQQAFLFRHPRAVVGCGPRGRGE